MTTDWLDLNEQFLLCRDSRHLQTDGQFMLFGTGISASTPRFPWSPC